MIPARSIVTLRINRRDFLRRASVAFSSGALLEDARGQGPKFAIAETSLGKIRGLDNHGIKTFRGIPYGASTEGSNRFMPPADPGRWTGVRDALEYGHSAPQRDPTAPPPTPGPLTASGTNLPAEGEDTKIEISGFEAGK